LRDNIKIVFEELTSELLPAAAVLLGDRLVSMATTSRMRCDAAGQWHMSRSIHTDRISATEFGCFLHSFVRFLIFPFPFPLDSFLSPFFRSHYPSNILSCLIPPVELRNIAISHFCLHIPTLIPPSLHSFSQFSFFIHSMIAFSLHFPLHR
jgi:hypothetical protein